MTHLNEFPAEYSLAGCSPAVKYQTGESGQTGKEQTAGRRCIRYAESDLSVGS
jgi:hypothetical protein